MRRTRTGYTMKQYAYAKNLLGAQGESKREIAERVGYAPSVASTATMHIERTEGFDNAMCALASESGNIMLKIYHSIKNKDLDKYPLGELLKAVEVMGQAWERFTPKASKGDDAPVNKLRSIVLQHVENQTVNTTSTPDKATK